MAGEQQENQESLPHILDAEIICSTMNAFPCWLVGDHAQVGPTEQPAVQVDTEGSDNSKLAWMH